MKAAYCLGPTQIFWYAVYKAGMYSGLYRHLSPVTPYASLELPVHCLFKIPNRQQIEQLLAAQPGALPALQREAEEICAGKVRLFGGEPVSLVLEPLDMPCRHWTCYEGHPELAGVEDLKFIWEPARFGWVYPLGRAYLIYQDERYPQAFWNYLDTFCAANPPNQGPNWSSAQEVALRLIALIFGYSVFQSSAHTDAKRRAQFAGVIAAHAQRIPLTLSYARAQNNNHLISEALGLYAAARALPGHPHAADWLEKGQGYLNLALIEQIHPDGVYAQHSINYHRLMLQASLQAVLFEMPLNQEAAQRLTAATGWLLAQIDPKSGRVPNLGANDGAHILPLASGPFSDYRSVGQAAARAFCGQPAFASGVWDETSLWLGQDVQPVAHAAPHLCISPAVHRMGDAHSWGSLRAVHFQERPSHADQLHVDLWWEGENIAMDAGTYRYTAPSPWDNALTCTGVHNTITIQDRDQMKRAGRFLWIDWAQAGLLNVSASGSEVITAEHNGYRALKILHQRTLEHAGPDHWRIIDHLISKPTLKPATRRDKIYLYRIHWLLPDWSWHLHGSAITLQRPGGQKFCLEISTNPGALTAESVSLVRAGQVLSGGSQTDPISGWYSPTYNLKTPALSFSISFTASLPLTIFSNWTID